MCYVAISLALLIPNAFWDKPTVRWTQNGPVEGVELISSMGQKYYAFSSIPFAEPPITGKDPYTGETVDRRFKMPEPLKRNWTENLNVQNAPPDCSQHSSVGDVNVEQSEDCLFLSIFVPAGGTEKKTVVIYLHGGGFTEGRKSEMANGPDFILNEDIIFVGIAYRLGMFGFLNLSHDEYSGNMGLKDQQLGLKWVYENIEKFSGNKNEILIMGLSAGGSSVGFHMANAESRKYFNRGYLRSGCIYSYFAMTRKDHLERMLNCLEAKDQMGIIDYIKTSKADDLLKCEFASYWGKTVDPKWGPTIERLNAKMPFITQSPDEIYEKMPPIDALFSFTDQEQLLFDYSIASATESVLNDNLVLPFENFSKDTYPKEYEEVMGILRNAYFSNVTDTIMIQRANIELMSDLNIRYGLLKNVLLQAKANNNEKNVFLFRFGVNDALNLLKFMVKDPYDGASHVDDYCYIFHCHFLDAFKVYDSHLKDKSSSAFKTLKRMVKMLANFARTGNPSIKDDTAFIACTPNDIFCQEINNDPISSVTVDILDQMHFSAWQEIEQIYKNLPAK